ncbi:UDP-N-acetyl-D-glucosamine 2-epimerase, UDP-hydrolysing [Halobacteriovorax marinus]|mgnify:CR=1 FL=1|uniref:UDP-N-acetyl-D-glucosamine 2-epimerase, UDP-hydrolysing n=1 Tax=Halobacteriovorax marinus TaxID=97084 RepID=A0A1Y5FGL3_9BACT|nr:UDP-N-acetyl-D-glucosamine 2-epimerase, UDP-hydrolysing [Halobacteriovorax marinus]
MIKRKICVVTSSRADYGLLYWPMKKIQDDPDLELQLIVTGTHLSGSFGHTYKLIESDGFKIDKKIEIIESGDSNVAVIKSMGHTLIGFSNTFNELSPDIVLVLGDRYEMFAVTQAAFVSNKVVAHMFGGDTTEGAQDEAFRHGMTKMSYLHFTSNEVSRQRVVQLGEEPERVFNVGSTGVDYIKNLKLLSLKKIENDLKLTFKKQNILVTYHPVTLENNSYKEDFKELLNALEELGDEFGIIFTKSNSDAGGRLIGEMIDEFVEKNPSSFAYFSLGQLRYLSVMSKVDLVLGNSSSGIYEAPSMGVATVNIGDRQGGRLQSKSILNSSPLKNHILNNIKIAMDLDCSKIETPYGNGNSSSLIIEILKKFPLKENCLKKKFYHVERNYES